MLKSSNINRYNKYIFDNIQYNKHFYHFNFSIINAVGEETFNSANNSPFHSSSLLEEPLPDVPLPLDNSTFDILNSNDTNEIKNANTTTNPTSGSDKNNGNSTNTLSDNVGYLGAAQLAEGVVQIFEPSLVKARGHLKELM